MWVEEESGQRVNRRRVTDIQAVVEEVPAQDRSRFVATACPFCMTMLEDGLASSKATVQDMDIAELVSEALNDGRGSTV
jgi:Fe-S oxidoreductase